MSDQASDPPAEDLSAQERGRLEFTVWRLKRDGILVDKRPRTTCPGCDAPNGGALCRTCALIRAARQRAEVEG